MIVRRIAVAVTCAGCMAVSSIAHAQSRSPQTPRANVTWTIGGAGAGFGIGLWAGLKAFDDSINSERKVWTTAVVSAAVGAVGGYLIGKARARHAGVSAVRSDAGLPVVASRRSLAPRSCPSQGQVDSGAENPRLPNHSARPDLVSRVPPCVRLHADALNTVPAASSSERHLRNIVALRNFRATPRAVS